MPLKSQLVWNKYFYLLDGQESWGWTLKHLVDARSELSFSPMQGKLSDKVVVDESTWTIEDQKLLRILLCKVSSFFSRLPTSFKSENHCKLELHYFRSLLDQQLFF